MRRLKGLEVGLPLLKQSEIDNAGRAGELSAGISHELKLRGVTEFLGAIKGGNFGATPS